MSAADALLSRLERVRQTGKAKWVARCPGHADRTPSLAVSETADGRLLIHCFSGCATWEVLSACGLGFDALFPERPLGHHAARERRPFNPSDVLTCLRFESLIVAVAAGNLAQGINLTDVDRERLTIAASRIQVAAEMCHA